MSLLPCVSHLLTSLFTNHCHCPFSLMYHIFSQVYLPTFVNVPTPLYITSTHKSIYQPLSLSLLPYVPHLLTSLFTLHCHCPYSLMYHIYSQVYLPLSVTVPTPLCTTSTHKSIYQPLSMSLLPYEPHLLTSLFTNHCHCPYSLMYHIYSQVYLPSTVTVPTPLCTTSTHKSIYQPLSLSLLPYVPHLLTSLFTLHCHCPYSLMYHIYSQVYLPTSVTVPTPLCTTSTHKSIYQPLSMSLLPYVPHLLTSLFTLHCHCPYSLMYHIYSQVYLPTSVTVPTPLCTTSTHKSIYQPLSLSLLPYVPHLLTSIFTNHCQCPYSLMYHIYSQVYLPTTVTVPTPLCTKSTHKSINQPLSMSLLPYVPHLLTSLFTNHCHCPYSLMYHIYSQVYLPSTVTVPTPLCTTSTHKSIDQPLSLLPYVPHLLTSLFTNHCHCPYSLVYHIYSQVYLPTTVTVPTPLCTTSTHKSIYQPLSLSLLPYVPHLLTSLLTNHCHCPYSLMYHIYSQVYLPTTVTVPSPLCTTSTHKSIDQPLSLSLLPYVPHLLTSLLTNHCHCHFSLMYHIYSQVYLPTTVTVPSPLCTTSSHKSIYQPLSLSLLPCVSHLLTSLLTNHCHCPYSLMYHI